MFKRSPYEIGRKSGLRFVICDSVAKENGGPQPKRTTPGIWGQKGSSGSHGRRTYLSKQTAVASGNTAVIAKCGVSGTGIVASNQFGIELATRSGVVREENRYYIQSIRNAEKRSREYREDELSGRTLMKNTVMIW